MKVSSLQLEPSLVGKEATHGYSAMMLEQRAPSCPGSLNSGLNAFKWPSSIGMKTPHELLSFIFMISTPFLLEIMLFEKILSLSTAYWMHLINVSMQVEKLTFESCWLTVGKTQSGATYAGNGTLWSCWFLFSKTERGIKILFSSSKT